MPDNGLYVYQRKAGDKKVTVIMNGSDEAVNGIDMSRYAEIMKPGDVFNDVISGKQVTIAEEMDFSPRAVLVLE